MKVDGACHCGAIAFEAEIDPETVTICHCTDCQTLSGSAYRANVMTRAEDFRLLRGRPSLYVKTADSGRRRAQAFCPDCGTQIYAADPDNPPSYSLRTGTLRQRGALKPRRQIWMRSALAWPQNLAAVPGVEQDK